MHRLVEAHRTADFESIRLRSVFHASQRHLEPPIISLPSEGRCAGSGACQRESSLGLRKFLHRWFLRLAAIQAWTQCSSRTLGRTPAQRPDSSEICLYLVRAPPVISTDSSAERPFGWRDVRPVVVGLWH